MYTTVYFYKNNIGLNKLIFGNPSFKIYLDNNKNNYQCGFTPESIFCVLHCTYLKYRTRYVLLYILRSLSFYEAGSVIKNVKPGADILLQARGIKHVNKVLRWLNTLNLSNASMPDAAFFIAASNRFATNLPPRDPAVTSPLRRLL
jgi:hypothetical protein